MLHVQIQLYRHKVSLQLSKKVEEHPISRKLYFSSLIVVSQKVIHNAIDSFRSSVIAVVISTKKPPGGLGWGKEKGTAPGTAQGMSFIDP